MEIKPKLVILIGLPGAGKSDYRDELNPEDKIVEIGTDDIRLELNSVSTKEEYQQKYFNGKIVEGGSKEIQVFDEAYKRIESNLIEGKHVVFEAVNLEENLVIPFIELGKKYKSKIELFHFYCPLWELLRRNKLRNENNYNFDKYILTKYYEFLKNDKTGEMNILWAEKYNFKVQKRNTLSLERIVKSENTFF